MDKPKDTVVHSGLEITGTVASVSPVRRYELTSHLQEEYNKHNK